VEEGEGVPVYVQVSPIIEYPEWLGIDYYIFFSLLLWVCGKGNQNSLSALSVGAETTTVWVRVRGHLIHRSRNGCDDGFVGTGWSNLFIPDLDQKVCSFFAKAGDPFSVVCRRVWEGQLGHVAVLLLRVACEYGPGGCADRTGLEHRKGSKMMPNVSVAVCNRMKPKLLNWVGIRV
jgi:hypothetical protein